MIPVLPGTVPDGDRHVRIFLRFTETVNAGNRGDDDDIITLVQGSHRRAAQLIDLVIDIRILLDVGIRRREIRLRLIIIIVGNEILDRIFREELLHLGIKLCRQGLVMRDDQRRLLQSLDDICHRKGLAGAGNTEQGLELISLLEAERQLFDGLRLITGRCIVRMKLEFVVFHSALQIVFSVYHRSAALNTCLACFQKFRPLLHSYLV